MRESQGRAVGKTLEATGFTASPAPQASARWRLKGNFCGRRECPLGDPPLASYCRAAPKHRVPTLMTEGDFQASPLASSLITCFFGVSWALGCGWTTEPRLSEGKGPPRHPAGAPRPRATPLRAQSTASQLSGAWTSLLKVKAALPTCALELLPPASSATFASPTAGGSQAAGPVGTGRGRIKVVGAPVGRTQAAGTLGGQCLLHLVSPYPQTPLSLKIQLQRQLLEDPWLPSPLPSLH